MKIYLAGGEAYYRNQIFDKIAEIKARGLKVNVLWSYWSVIQRAGEFRNNADSFMLDSGAFSFMQSGKSLNWDEYVTRYIDFIKTYKPNFFFELDIDKFIGYDRVKEIRRRLERETGKRPIPVWHKHLGNKEFLRMCDEYDYVSIGGLASKEITLADYKFLPAFIREAHKRGAKIHGLGFSHSAWLPICHFDSVDTTSWVGGPRYGQIYTFDGKKCHYTKKPKGHRVKNYDCAEYNFEQWVKFANWAEEHL